MGKAEEWERGWRMENGGWRLFQKSILNPPSSILASTSSIHEIDELPASFAPPQLAVVIQGRIGELRRGDPEVVLLHETLGHDSFQLRPEIVFIPVLKNA